MYVDERKAKWETNKETGERDKGKRLGTPEDAESREEKKRDSRHNDKVRLKEERGKPRFYLTKSRRLNVPSAALYMYFSVLSGCFNIEPLCFLQVAACN